MLGAVYWFIFEKSEEFVNTQASALTHIFARAYLRIEE
jgi:hypothetical protein